MLSVCFVSGRCRIKLRQGGVYSQRMGYMHSPKAMDSENVNICQHALKTLLEKYEKCGAQSVFSTVQNIAI